MTTLKWDEVGARRFETGIERGVLYMPNGVAVPWNGLVSLTENLGNEVKSYYIDGIKYLDHQTLGAFSGNLQAFTYPDELDELLGTMPFKTGVFVHDQRPKTFNLCYRTKVGNDVDGIDHGYKVHILYNVLATPGNSKSESIKEKLDPELFEWALTSVPSLMTGIRPTSHISLHSRSIPAVLLTDIEKLLYGTDTAQPNLPTLVELLKMVEEHYVWQMP